MTRRELSFGGIALNRVPGGWNEVTDLEDGAPFTLAKPDGVGALQFSPAVYKGGRVPSPSVDDLLEMVTEFGVQHDLGDAFGYGTDDATIRLAGANYHDGEDFIRVWYVSDGKSFVLVTYVCQWGLERKEIDECEEIVRSVRFTRS